ncbi:hypothetical protein PILCRDRAFT_825021 [Piloderma croceum F 1598]|uniref:Uncharacterized protein n=1 Tax=Piloderma croceum (strain F 1598) TaxID=765440 RepID=A0A0C3EZ12_PILCF|nr:hypothetical protein PILCRDRAFT_825021 [Piloderma croceum F 1598]
MRIYALYEHPGFDFSSNEASGSIISKTASAFTHIAASCIALYEIMSTEDRSLQPSRVQTSSGETRAKK